MIISDHVCFLVQIWVPWMKINRLIQDKETVFHFAALNEKSADMFAIMEKYAANLDLIKQSNLQLQVSVFSNFWKPFIWNI